ASLYSVKNIDRSVELKQCTAREINHFHSGTANAEKSNGVVFLPFEGLSKAGSVDVFRERRM
ncbi:hypothetical protein, partial [Petrachloros mirabilis]